MSANDLLSWLLCIGVVSINGVLVYIAWWALFSDRARGRRRCPKCWYDMAYSPGSTCPECGFAAHEERDFSKTRRRYRVAMLAVFTSVAIAVYITDRVTQRGYATMLPTRALLWMMPLADSSNSSIFNELLSRSYAKTLSQSEWLDLVERCAQGDFRAKPVTDAWINKYGDFITNNRPTSVREPSVEKLLSDIPPRIDVTTRDVWPENTPVALSVQVRDWWPYGTECRIRATPRLPGAKSIVFGRSGDDTQPRGAYSVHLPSLDPSTKEVIVDFEIERRRLRGLIGISPVVTTLPESDPQTRWRPASKQSITVPVKIKGNLEQLATPAGSPAMTEAIKQVFATGAVKWVSGSSPVRFNINVGATSGNEFDDTAIGMTAELLFEGRVARHLSLWWIGGKGGLSRTDVNYGFEIGAENLELLRQLTAEDNRWQMRLSSDPLLALRAGKATKYWSGEITMPLKLEVREQAAPSRGWWTEEE